MKNISESIVRNPLSTEIAAFLNKALAIDNFPEDPSNNGLQVENKRKITKICCGVDASLEFFEEAIRRGSDMCIVHHGISWGRSLSKISGLNYKILSFLIENNIALYAAHLPLDAHPVLGNNAVLSKAIGLGSITPYFVYAGYTIGMKGVFSKPISRTELNNRLKEAVGSSSTTVFPYGPEKITSVGVVSGGAADDLDQAVDAGLDAYITGECGLQAYNCAKGNSINAFFAGHYHTETFGVKSLGKLVSDYFSIPWDFVDFDLPY